MVKPKKIPQEQPEDKNQTSFNPEEFEDIDLTSNLPEDMKNNHYQEVDLSESISKITTPSPKLSQVKNELEKRLILDNFSEALSAESGTEYLGFENIVGVGISEKITNNQFTGQPCVTVYVAAKESTDQIYPEALIPKAINGVVTDVVAVGELNAFPNKGRYRPSPFGVSVGHYQITAGTLGCLVSQGNILYILSNNHILANSNMGSIGDPIVQPGPYDGGVSAINVVARLSSYIPINFDGQPNLVDAAIAQASPPLVTPESKCFGTISSTPVPCSMWQVVKKCGRTTQATYGVVTDCNATVRVGYGTSGVAVFQNQMIIYGIPYVLPFSAPGDSGSLILSAFGNNPVGLLFAGSQIITIASPIQTVLNSFGVSIVS